MRVLRRWRRKHSCYKNNFTLANVSCGRQSRWNQDAELSWAALLVANFHSCNGSLLHSSLSLPEKKNRTDCDGERAQSLSFIMTHTSVRGHHGRKREPYFGINWACFQFDQLLTKKNVLSMVIIWFLVTCSWTQRASGVQTTLGWESLSHRLIQVRIFTLVFKTWFTFWAAQWCSG